MGQKIRPNNPYLKQRLPHIADKLETSNWPSNIQMIISFHTKIGNTIFFLILRPDLNTN